MLGGVLFPQLLFFGWPGEKNKAKERTMGIDCQLDEWLVKAVR